MLFAEITVSADIRQAEPWSPLSVLAALAIIAVVAFLVWRRIRRL
jgi:hypothetical protein